MYNTNVGAVRLGVASPQAMWPNMAKNVSVSTRKIRGKIFGFSALCENNVLRNKFYNRFKILYL